MTHREQERARAIQAMDILATSVSNENYLDPWLMSGVADGDIDWNLPEEERLQFIVDAGYTEDSEFARITGVFLRVMKLAEEDGGLYIGGIVGQ